MRNKLKSKGFTLMELIVVIGIMSICVGVILPYMNNYQDKILDIEMDRAVNGVVEFINGCKSYARNNDTFAKNSRFVIEERKFTLFQNTKEIRRYILPDSVKVMAPSKSTTINLEATGQINHAITISLSNFRGTIESITIKVGTGYVSKKK